MAFKIHNRRYTGSKYKIANWIENIINDECPNAESFCDIFAGTGVVTERLINKFNSFHKRHLSSLDRLYHESIWSVQNFPTYIICIFLLI